MIEIKFTQDNTRPINEEYSLRNYYVGVGWFDLESIIKQKICIPTWLVTSTKIELRTRRDTTSYVYICIKNQQK